MVDLLIGRQLPCVGLCVRCGGGSGRVKHSTLCTALIKIRVTCYAKPDVVIFNIALVYFISPSYNYISLGPCVITSSLQR